MGADGALTNPDGNP
jgi:cytochrome P450